MTTSHVKSTKEGLIKQAEFNRHFSATEWADYNRKFFNDLAPKYDYLNQVITLGMQEQYKAKVVDRAAINDGDLVLDICTGSGDMAFLVAKKYPHSHVIGVDVAEKMLQVARDKAQGISNVEFQWGDAMKLPFENEMFDATIMSYGLRNLTDFVHGIKEMKRVTKPGGSITIVDLGKPRGLINKMIYSLYFENVMPFLGKHVFHRGEFNSFKYLPESNKFFPPPEELKKVLLECGLREVKTYTYMMGIVSQQVGIVAS